MSCEEVLRKLVFREPLTPDERSHLEDCPGCAGRAVPAERVARALAERPQAAAASAADIARIASPWLERNRRRALATSIGRAVGAALLPLPFVLLWNFVVLRSAYALLQQFLPQNLSAAVVVGQAGLMALLLAIAYGAIPLLADRQARARTERRHA